MKKSVRDKGCSNSRQIVFSLVGNPGTTDGRVMKQARALRDHGREVYLFGHATDGFPKTEIHDGINVQRFECFAVQEDGAHRAKIAKLYGGQGQFVASTSKAIAEATVEKREKYAAAAHLREVVLEKGVELREVADALKMRRRDNKAFATQNKLFDRSSIDRAYLQGALRLQRSILGLHWSGKVRRERRKYHRELLARMNDLIAKDDSLRNAEVISSFKRKFFSNSEKMEEVSRLSKKVRDLKAELDDCKKSHAEAKVEYFNAAKALQGAMSDGIFYVKAFQFAENLLERDFDAVPDVIHSHDLLTLPGAVALGERFGAKVVFDAHEIETERNANYTEKQKTFIATMEHDLFAHLDALIVCCDSAGDFYEAVFKKARATVIMNAPDNRFWSDCDDPEIGVRKRLGFSESVPLIVYVGGVGTESRGVDVVIQALAYLPDYHLAIQGPRREDFDSRLRAVAQESGCADRVHFLCSVDQEVLISSLKDVDLGVCPFQDVSLNHRYALPNKLFEMAFARIPMCVSDLVEMKRFVEATGTGVAMDQTSPESISRAIKCLYENRTKYRPALNSKSTLETDYSWATQIDKLIELYQELESQ